MIERGEIEEVEPSAEHADLLLSQAQGHLASSESLVTMDPPSALVLIYDGARKALTAALAKQGLRTTSKGGHVAVQHAVEAQLGANARKVIRAFGALRRRRNDTEYPDIGHIPISSIDAADALDDAREIVDAIRRFVPRLGPWW